MGVALLFVCVWCVCRYVRCVYMCVVFMYTALHVCGVELVGKFHDRISGMPSIWLISQALDWSQTGQERL